MVHKPDPPPPIPTTDPTLDARQAAADAANVAALQTTAQQDTASLMAQYGTRLALANTATSSVTSPLATAAAMLPGAGGAFGTAPIVNAVFGGKAA